MIDFSNIKEFSINGTDIKSIDINNVRVWEKSSPEPVVDYSVPFYIEDVSGSDNTLTIKKTTLAPTLTIEKSSNGKSWETIGETSTTGITATVPANSKLYLRCSANTWGGDGYYNSITCSSRFNVGGNIMSLLYGSSFTGEETTFPTGSSYNFYYLFSGVRTLASAQNLLLPATTLTEGCYHSLFKECYSLTVAPALPATTLTDYCYYYLFQGCTSLTSAPALPATTLSYRCYYGLFMDCTSLTSAPELPATTLAPNCYENTFCRCTSLTTAPALPATTLTEDCYSDMFSGCTSLTSAPELPATTLAYRCYYGMFIGCTSLTSAPALPATTLADACYYYMFSGCTSLTVAPALPATTLTRSCYSDLFRGCTSLTSAPELPATTLAAYCYQEMFYGCTSLSYIKVGFSAWPNMSSSTESDYRATYQWTRFRINTTGTFVCPAALPQYFNKSGNNINNTSISNYISTNVIPYGWTVQTY